jgi:hypothetical protein
MLSFIMLSVIMLSVIMLIVIMQTVVAPSSLFRHPNSVEESFKTLTQLAITELLAKPFSFVSGNVPKRRFNPFRYLRFVTPLTCGLYYKTFRIVIYDRNDSTIVEPVL